jgi:hypothetical protein
MQHPTFLVLLLLCQGQLKALLTRKQNQHQQQFQLNIDFAQRGWVKRISNNGQLGTYKGYQLKPKSEQHSSGCSSTGILFGGKCHEHAVTVSWACVQDRQMMSV